MLRYFLLVFGLAVGLVGPVDFSVQDSSGKESPTVFSPIANDPGGPVPKCPPPGCEEEN